MRLKIKLSILITILAFQSCMNELDDSKGTYNALAKLISIDKEKQNVTAKYKIIKDFRNKNAYDTITVTYNHDESYQPTFQTAFLRIRNKNGEWTNDGQFICPLYNAKLGINDAKIDTIPQDYWANCDTIKPNCMPLTFHRKQDQKNWYLIIPCVGKELKYLGGQSQTNTSFTFTGGHNSCPALLEISEFKDGKYYFQQVDNQFKKPIEFIITTDK